MDRFKKVKQPTKALKVNLPFDYKKHLESYCLTHNISLKDGVMRGIELLMQRGNQE